jgi:NhaA family Na+:H+ antiporter
MAIFFFLVGLEIKRETMVGELSTVKTALLPIIAALGGMIFPGLIYAAFNFGTTNMSGWAIPMATDIAFAIGAIAVFGRSLPVGLRIFLAAFAIADDLGAVIIIAIFYTKDIFPEFLVAAVLLALGMEVMNLFKIRWVLLYIIVGILLWLAVLYSGVHPTIAGVVAAFTIPVRGRYNAESFSRRVHGIMGDYKCNDRDGCYWYSILMNRSYLEAVHELKAACKNVETPLQQLEYALHPWVAFIILPIFALSNAGLSFERMVPSEAILNPVTLGIVLGLLVGKPVGIWLFSLLAVKLNLAGLPEGVRWSHLWGAGMLGGIGFTMSLFISGLSFTSVDLLNFSKLGILCGSLLSAIGGVLFLWLKCVRGSDVKTGCE